MDKKKSFKLSFYKLFYSCELPRPKGRGFQRLEVLYAIPLICWFAGPTSPSSHASH